jgi:hypothetical protein
MKNLLNKTNMITLSVTLAAWGIAKLLIDCEAWVYSL